MSIYKLKARFQALLRPAVRKLHSLGVTANQVTVTAWIVSVALGVILIGAPHNLFLMVPLWMFLRMALNAVDGMLAREFGQKSALGAYLNEISDVVSDAALYLPFAFVAPLDWRSVGAVVFFSALSEIAGILGLMIGASRRYDGPMGKSDRAFSFSVLAIAVAAMPRLPIWTAWIVWAIAAATAATVLNRVRCGLREITTAASSARGPMQATQAATSRPEV